MTGKLTITTVAVLVASGTPNPPRWQRSANPATPAPSTIIPYGGNTFITGGYLIARINLDYINATCSKYSRSLNTASQVYTVLAETQLRGVSGHQAKRYGYVLLRLAAELRETLYYLHDLLLCPGRGGEIWSNFVKARDQANLVWPHLRRLGVSDNIYQTQQFPNRTPSSVVSRNPFSNESGDNLIEL